MTRAEAPPSRAARRRTHRRRRGRRLIRVVVAVGVGIPLLALGYYAGLAAVVGSDVRRVEALSPDGAEVLHPDDPAQTYLLVGTGLRGPDAGPDTTIVMVHVPPQDAPSTAVVLPALAYVDVPNCDDDDGAPVEPYAGPLDSVLATGGAGCLVRTVQQVTGLAVDHYLQFDVAAVADVVESVGPVPVCLPSAVPELGLRAGPQRLDGAEVLALLRTAAE
ncbi:MAG: LCP family protein, partial [Geodermatophilaceae bacterium]|nr:LCP family protein [Geodermatophilaceae bacterium]